MGQRHQLFAVAKVNGKYRTLAVTHHQWLCGYDVIQRCFSLLEIFRANASGIARELRRAATLDWAKDVPKDKDVVSNPSSMTAPGIVRTQADLSTDLWPILSLHRQHALPRHRERRT